MALALLTSWESFSSSCNGLSGLSCMYCSATHYLGSATHLDNRGRFYNPSTVYPSWLWSYNRADNIAKFSFLIPPKHHMIRFFTYPTPGTNFRLRDRTSWPQQFTRESTELVLLFQKVRVHEEGVKRWMQVAKEAVESLHSTSRTQGEHSEKDRRLLKPRSCPLWRTFSNKAASPDLSQEVSMYSNMGRGILFQTAIASVLLWLLLLQLPSLAALTQLL